MDCRKSGFAPVLLFYPAPLLNRDGPDFLGILFDGPVGRKLAHPGDIEYSHSGPGVSFKKSIVYPVLALNIGFEVKEEQIRVMFVHQAVNEGFEQFFITIAERTVTY